MISWLVWCGFEGYKNTREAAGQAAWCAFVRKNKMLANYYGRGGGLRGLSLVKLPGSTTI